MIVRTSPPMRLRTVTVKDRMQQGYVYALVEPAGRNFNPEFRPELTPAEILKLGVFGGKYLTDCRDEFPASWFKGAKLSPERSNPSLNFFAFTRASRSPFGGPKVDSSRRSSWLVSMVLPLFPGPPDGGRCAPDQALEGNASPRSPNRARL